MGGHPNNSKSNSISGFLWISNKQRASWDPCVAWHCNQSIWNKRRCIQQSFSGLCARTGSFVSTFLITIQRLLYDCASWITWILWESVFREQKKCIWQSIWQSQMPEASDCKLDARSVNQHLHESNSQVSFSQDRTDFYPRDYIWWTANERKRKSCLANMTRGCYFRASHFASSLQSLASNALLVAMPMLSLNAAHGAHAILFASRGVVCLGR